MRRFLASCVLGAAVALSTTSGVEGQQPGEPFGTSIEVPERYVQAVVQSRVLVRKFMQDQGVPGSSIAVGVEGRIVWSEGFGWADVENQVPVTTLTRFRSGSTAKPITEAAAARLYEQGRFDFDAPIQKYVPSFPVKGPGPDWVITPRELMAHTAGIRHYPPNGTEFFSIKRYTNIVDALEIFENDPLLFQPGTKYSYSTYGANLLGAAVQGAAGKDFLTVLKELVFDPIGMRATLGEHSDSIIMHRTRFYERTGQKPGYHRRQSSWGDGTTRGVLLNGPFADNSNKWAGGGLLTTPEDLVRFGSAHLQPGYLKAETLEMLFTSARLKDGSETGRGLNWDLQPEPRWGRVVAHGGGGVGGTSTLRVYLDQKVVVAIQANLTDAGFGDLDARVGDLFSAARHDTPPGGG